MFCSSCGSKNNDAARFCSSCGKEVDIASKGDESSLDDTKDESTKLDEVALPIKQFCGGCGCLIQNEVHFCPNCGLMKGAAPKIESPSPAQAAIDHVGHNNRITFFRAIAICFGRYSDFKGRASRKEFWYFYTFIIFVSVIMAFLANALESEPYLAAGWNFMTMVPVYSVTSRRMHDTNRSFWNYLWILTVIGIIPVLIWLASKGDQGTNRYGVPQ